MREKILNFFCKKIKNVRLAIFLTDIITITLDIVFYFRYFTTVRKKHIINNKKINYRKQIILNNENIIRSKKIEYDLSIIVPTYNNRDKIKNCIESVLCQNINYRYEVIIIDDGSTDNTLEILNEYKDKQNFKIISQENLGVAAARNRGLQVCRGKYIMFIDSDDIISEDCIEILMNETKVDNFDIIEGNYLNIYGHETKTIGKPLWNSDFSINLDENPEFILNIKGYPWGRIYSRKLWEKVEFPCGFDYEDTVIKFIVFRQATKFRYVNHVVYNYYIDKKSITNKLKGSIKSLDTFYILEYLIKLNMKLNLKFDPVLYKIVLHQLGRMLYFRTVGLEQEIVDDILIQSRDLLINIEEYTPRLDLKDFLLKKSILSKNREKWRVCCKNR